MRDIFLPFGYPDSVAEEYSEFQIWDTVQALCTYLRGVLATQAVLQSVGVGDSMKTPLSAALQWVLRDGVGMVGSLAVAYALGPQIGSNVKFWRLFADAINDIALTLGESFSYNHR